MRDPTAGWWMSGDDGRWNYGRPPEGWWQAKNGRWYPPIPPPPPPPPLSGDTDLDETTRIEVIALDDADDADETVPTYPATTGYEDAGTAGYPADDQAFYLGPDEAGTTGYPADDHAFYLGPDHATAPRRGVPGVVDTYRSWPRWAKLAAPTAAMILGIAAISALALPSDEGSGETASVEETTTTAESTTTTDVVTTTTAPPTTTSAPPPTTVAPTTVPPTTESPTTAPPATAPPTTAPPATQPPTTAPPTTAAPPPVNVVRPGAFCEPPGATGRSADGEPMTCATERCNGMPYDQPRWRKANC